MLIPTLSLLLRCSVLPVIAGQAFFYDDAFEFSIVNPSAEPLVFLSMDVWYPGVEEEVKEKRRTRWKRKKRVSEN